MESWMFRDPALIADGLIRRSERIAEREQLERERKRVKKSALHRRQVLIAKRGK